MNLSSLSKNREHKLYDKKLVEEKLRDIKAEKLLDTGCGNGDFTRRVGDVIKAQEIHGIEIDKGKAEQARKKGIKVKSIDLNSPLPFKDNYFDVIISIQCIEHLCFTDRYLEEVKRVLKKEGVFILTTTNLAGLHYRLMLLLGMQPMCLHPSKYKAFPLKGEHPLYGHKSVFTYAALKEVLEKHNFKILEGYTHSLYLIPRTLSNIICKCFKNTGIYTFFVLSKSR